MSHLHNLLVRHYRHPHPATAGEQINGYAPRGCLGCDEVKVRRCWCGSQVGDRVPGDQHGLGCLANINHDWAGETR